MREKIRTILVSFFKQDIPDHQLVLSLMNLCAYYFAYPEFGTAEDRELVKAGYIQLQEKGYL